MYLVFPRIHLAWVLFVVYLFGFVWLVFVVVDAVVITVVVLAAVGAGAPNGVFGQTQAFTQKG